MNTVSTRTTLFASLASSGAALALLCAPPTLGDAVRGSVRDAILPGNCVAVGLVEHTNSLLVEWRSRLAAPTNPPVIAGNATSGNAAEFDVRSRGRIRALEAEVARLREELERRRGEQAAVLPATPGSPLMVPDLLTATVLGEETASRWRAGTLLQGGAADGVTESSLVLESEAPLLDQGRDAGLETGQPVLAGRVVLGRIARSGKWTSTLQHVTDPEFRGLAQIVRRTQRGVAFGAQGILEGDGNGHCRLKFVDATEAISVGDDVFTADLEDLVPVPLYYGRIVSATLKPGASHWDIRVRPAGVGSELREVQVLRSVGNPARFVRTAGKRGARAAAAN